MIEYRLDRRSDEQRVFDAAEPVLLRALGDGRITLSSYRSAMAVIRPGDFGVADRVRRLKVLELTEDE